MNAPVTFTILGQPPSKSNCYRVVTLHGHGALAKCPALKRYEEAFFMQCPCRGLMLKGRFAVTLKLFFGSDLPDIDNPIKTILDCLQACKVIDNDRHVCRVVAEKMIDKKQPRVEVTIEKVI